MPLYRKTAIVRLELPSGATAESLPLTTDRTFGVLLTIEGQAFAADYFHSPIADEQWRDFSRRLSLCNTTRDDKQQDLLNRNAMFIRGIGSQLYSSLAALSVPLQAFLDQSGTPRRLVIQSTRSELHLLPWGALFDNGGNLLAAGDLSIVQSWNDFSPAVAITQSKLTVLRVLGENTPGATIAGLENPPPEIVSIQDKTGAQPDILHVEAHGNAVTHQIDDRSSTSFADRYGAPKIALLWSCFSAAANSWGDSPALCLHRDGAALVLSFQAELHVNDATSISAAFYREVFGAAASRDPETALVHARASKYLNEFAYANWASMTVYLSNPLDLSALPLNGPRTPSSRWSSLPAPDPVPAFLAPAAPPPLPDTSLKLWSEVVSKVRDLEPGNWKQMPVPDGIDPCAPLPRSVFGAWRGNVVLLDSGAGGNDDPLTSEVLQELDLGRLDPPTSDPAETLVWFFDCIAHYGSPLVLWINSKPHHMEFLKVVQPDPGLSFLLLTAAEPTEDTATIPELVDLNSLEEATARGRLLLECIDAGIPASDEDLFAAYYASIRVEKPDDANRYLRQLNRLQEWLLLTGNFISRRDKRGVRDAAELLDLGGRFLAIEEQLEDPSPSGTGEFLARADFEALRRPEDFYRLAMNLPADQCTPRETARAKHELAYLKQQQGRPGTAELFYRLALDDVLSCPAPTRDSRWRNAISSILRDLADLLSGRPERLRDASTLLDRAMAIQAFHGMSLQLGYSETTAARIAHTQRHNSDCIHLAVSAANRMEECRNFRGWTEALGILFDSLAETRETARMIAFANLAREKIRAANPDEDDNARQERLFKFAKGRAHWIAGDVAEARGELEGIVSSAPEDERSAMDREIDQLLAFLRVTHPTRA